MTISFLSRDGKGQNLLKFYAITTRFGTLSVFILTCEYVMLFFCLGEEEDQTVEYRVL